MKLRKRKPDPEPVEVVKPVEPEPSGKIARAQAAVQAARLELEDLHSRRNATAKRLHSLGDDDEQAQARAAERALFEELTGRIERQAVVIGEASRTVGTLQDERTDLMRTLERTRQKWSRLFPYADILAGACDACLDVERAVGLPQGVNMAWRKVFAFVEEIRGQMDSCTFLEARISEYGQ